MLKRTTHVLFIGILGLLMTIPSLGTTRSGNAIVVQTDQQGGGRARPKNAVRFTLLRMGDGVTADGARFSQDTYEGPNGEKAFAVIVYCDSPEHAKKQFGDKIKKATKIIEQQKLSDEKDATEERAVITFIAGDKKLASMILTTEGAHLREIKSYSLQDALDLEKQIKH